MSASDRFGSLGLVGVFIAQREQNTAIVDSLLMSCRALGRSLEFTFALDCMRRVAANWGIEGWIAEYIPTVKNEQVATFWSALGFTLIEEEADGHRRYRLRASVPKVAPPFFIHIEGE